MRVVAFDVGTRRTGVAVSDPSGTLARPLTVLTGDALAAAVGLVADLRASADGLETIVVGLPRRLDGSPNEQTASVERFAAALASATGLPVMLQDERLTSVDAEARLAERQKDWRKRKARLDAAAAAVILQEYLDTVALADATAADSDPIS